MRGSFGSSLDWKSVLERTRHRLLYLGWSLRIRLTSGFSARVLTLCVSTIFLLLLIFYTFSAPFRHHHHYHWDNGIYSKPPQIPLTPHQSNRLETLFYKVDQNKDGQLSEPEIVNWIVHGVEKHFTEALNQNFVNFFKIDKNPKNGLVSWSEYLAHALEELGVNGNQITVQDVRTKSEAFKKLSKTVKVEISQVEARWLEAASNNPDFLTVDEFLALEHPEASPTKLLETVEELFFAMDLNGDGNVVKAELETPDKEVGPVDPIYKDDFDIIDTDKDGGFNRHELLKYLDPRKPHHARREASRLFYIADSNQDEQLSLKEVLSHGSSLVNSKLYDASKNLHKH